MVNKAPTKPTLARPDRPELEVQEERPDVSGAVKATRVRAGEVSVVDSHAPVIGADAVAVVDSHAPILRKKG